MKLEGEFLERKPRLRQGQRLKSCPRMQHNRSNMGSVALA